MRHIGYPEKIVKILENMCEVNVQRSENWPRVVRMV